MFFCKIFSVKIKIKLFVAPLLLSILKGEAKQQISLGFFQITLFKWETSILDVY